jgi:hypothetical protein
MLYSWQTFLLDAGIWLLPLAAVAALAFFPWKHWNLLLDD